MSAPVWYLVASSIYGLGVEGGARSVAWSKALKNLGSALRDAGFAWSAVQHAEDRADALEEELDATREVRDDAQTDADRVAESWHELKAAALAVLSAVEHKEARSRLQDDDFDNALDALGVACHAEMPGGGESRAERYRKALQAIADHPHAADDYDDGQGDSAVCCGHIGGHQCAAEVARAALAGGKEQDNAR